MLPAALQWMSVIDRVGVLQIAPATVFNRLPLIFWKQMDFLHVKSAVEVRCDWCAPRSDVAL